MTVTYRTYVWIEDGTDTDALVLGGGGPDQRFVIEAAADSLIEVG